MTKAEMIGAFEDIREQAKNLPEMTPEEIDYEIYLARKERL